MATGHTGAWKRPTCAKDGASVKARTKSRTWFLLGRTPWTRIASSAPASGGPGGAVWAPGAAAMAIVKPARNFHISTPLAANRCDAIRIITDFESDSEVRPTAGNGRARAARPSIK